METNQYQETITCACCGLAGQLQGDTKDPMGISQKRNICPQCLKHASTQDMQKRNRDHLIMWKENLEVQLQKQKNEFEVQKEALITLNLKMKSELESRPTQTVIKNLDEDIVNEAVIAKEEAWRYRDLAFGIISLVRSQHKQESNGICHCSLRLEKCATHKVFKEDPNGMEKALLKWETDKKSQFDSGNSFHVGGYIPNSHPMVTNPRWTPTSFRI